MRKRLRGAYVALAVIVPLAYAVVFLPQIGKARFVRQLGGVQTSISLPRLSKARLYQFSAPAAKVREAARRELEASGFDLVTDSPKLMLFTKSNSGEAIQFATGDERLAAPLPGSTCEVLFDTLL